MTIHLCRDLLTLPTASAPGTSFYLVSMFLRHVMSFDVKSFQNFNIDASTYTKGQFNLNPAIPQFGSINLATGSENIVWLPLGSYSGSSADINRILALRSDAFPTFNSGLFRITAVTASLVSGTGLTIDYRSSEFPPQESGSLVWRVYESELAVSSSWLSGSNGSTGYNSRGSAANTRVMFNTTAGYNLRLSLESHTDQSGTVPGGFTIAPGAGAVGQADFDNLAGHLHGPMWFDTTSSLYRGLAVGLSPQVSGGVDGLGWTTGQWRFYAAGDTLKSTIVCFTRNVSFTTGGNGWCVFGIPEDEPQPVSQNIIDRLFVVGFGTALPNLTWRSGFFNDGHTQGVAWSRYGFPAPCVMSSYADIRNQDPHVRDLSTANDTPFLGMTELVDVELFGGTMTSSLAATTTLGVTASAVVPYAPRRVGRMPIVRQGRSNYAQWALTPNKQWLHTLDGIFVPWAGPHLIGSVTGSSNALLVATSSLIDGTGIQFFEPNPPMSDPEVPTAQVPSDIDATRYRKTYSYFRQQVVEVSVVPGGSNPAKP